MYDVLIPDWRTWRVWKLDCVQVRTRAFLIPFGMLILHALRQLIQVTLLSEFTIQIL